MRPRELLDRLAVRARGDRVLGGMTPRPPPDVLEVCRLYSWQNMGDPESYTASREAASYIVSTASLVVFGREYPGWVTSGASEGNLLALYALREMGYRRVLYFQSAHYSIPKSARILGMRAEPLPVAGGYEPLLGELRSRLGEGDIVVATVGTTETGYIDPVVEIAELAGARGAVVHVDAAFAGPIMRHLGEGKAPRSLGGAVTSIVMDMHKVPEAPAGVGLLLASDKGIIDLLYHKAPYIPSGRQFGVLGTRNGGPVIAAAYALSKLVEYGVERLAGELMDAALELVSRLGPHGYRTPHGVETPILCLIHPHHDRVFRRLGEMGYKAYRCLEGRGVRMAVMPHLIPELDRVSGILASAAGG